MNNILRHSKKCKYCADCKKLKSINSFVTIYGYESTYGKYCQSCFNKHQLEQAMYLMGGRNFCLYCGVKIKKAYDYTPKGSSIRTYLHRDHMDPLSLGGENTDANLVYCCVGCNLKKRNKLFLDWLSELSPKYKKISRKIYIDKHSRSPEEFIQENYELEY